MKEKTPDQEVNIWPPPQGSGSQRVHVNPPKASSSTPHFAAGTSQLVILVAVGLFLVIVACGIASALTAGAIW